MVAETARRRLLAAYLPAAIWSVLVAGLLLAPSSSFAEKPALDALDLPVHAVLFAVETLVLARAAAAAGLAWPVPAAVAAAYALALEAAQVWVPGRSWEVSDLVAGLGGVALAAVVLTVVASRRRSH